jgi:protein-tyrosine-phosphatase
MASPGVSTRLLFVCTGNQCRSPMAEALMRARLAERPSQIQVESAGIVAPGLPPPAAAVDVMRSLGVDISAHRSRIVDATMLERSDLIVVMTRQHLVELASMELGRWDRIFTISELVRRGEAVGPRGQDEPLANWIVRVQAGRRGPDLIALPLEEDIPDPMGNPKKSYRRVAEQLRGLTGRLADLLAPA